MEASGFLDEDRTGKKFRRRGIVAHGFHAIVAVRSPSPNRTARIFREKFSIKRYSSSL